MTKKLNNKGFTIIEVLIVLAIAGLILLIVFLAVPALQRSSRNQSRKTDASSLLAAVTEYENNNNGTLPKGYCVNISNQIIFSDASGNDTPATAKLGYYTKTATGGYNSGTCSSVVTSDPGTALGVGIQTTATTSFAGGSGTGDRITVYQGATCDGGTKTNFGQSNPSFSPVAGAARQIAVVYTTEAGANSYTVSCLSS